MCAMAPQPERPPPWWLEAWALTRVVFSVLFWPLVALLALILALGGTVVAFSIHWAWGVTALALTVLAVGLFLWWDRSRPPRL